MIYRRIRRLSMNSWNKSLRNDFLFVILSTILFVALMNVAQIRAPTSESGTPIFVGPVPPYDFATIQEAVNNANDGDFIEVTPEGSPYNETVVVNKSVTVRRWPGSASTLPVVVNGGFEVRKDWVTIFNFTIQNGRGIHVYNSSGVVLKRNMITNNAEGVHLERSSNVTLSYNTLTANTLSFGVEGRTLPNFLHTINTTNTINGKPIRYLINQSNLVINSTTFPQGIGYLGVVNSQNINVSDLSFRDNIQAVLLAYTNNSKIKNIVTSSEHKIGIDLLSSYYNTVEKNVISKVIEDGIFLSSSSHNIIRNNNVAVLGGLAIDGIGIWSSSHNIISNNSVAVSSGASAIDIYSSYNVISNNSISYSSFSQGIYVAGSSNIFSDNYIRSTIRARVMTSGIMLSSSSNNSFYGNTIVDNQWGIDLFNSIDNIFFHNNIYNSVDFQVHSENSSTIWELNSLEGNYWSDYRGEDRDKDGIGDTPYPIGDPWWAPTYWNNDTRPLIEPWKPKRIHPDPTWYGPTTVTTFSNSTVKIPFILNKEEKAILINVTSGAGGFLEVTILRDRLDGPFTLFIDDQEILNYLLNQNQTHTIFYLNFPQGIHHIKIRGTRLCLIYGDVNGDGKVDGKDIAAVAKNFGKSGL